MGAEGTEGRELELADERGLGLLGEPPLSMYGRTRKPHGKMKNEISAGFDCFH